MRHVGHSLRSVAIEPLKLVLMRTYNHQVRTDMELLARGSAFRRFHPGATIHVRDADAINARGPAGQAVLNPVQEYRVEAPWFIMRIPGNSRETGPFVRAFAKNPVFASRRRRPVEQRRAFGDEYGTGAQCVGDFLCVSDG